MFIALSSSLRLRTLAAAHNTCPPRCLARAPHARAASLFCTSSAASYLRQASVAHAAAETIPKMASATDRSTEPPAAHGRTADADNMSAAVTLAACTQAERFHASEPAAPPQAALAAGQAAAAERGFQADLARALRGVVKIFTTTASPNHSLPWQMHAQSKCTASGFIIAPLHRRRILTNAHAVANQVQVMVRKHGSARKFAARVLAVGHECDIAMLTVDNDEFWSPDVLGMEVDGLPAMQESVTVVGFPAGGDNVCVTKGVVSRLDRQTYSHGRTALLAIQIDAAINSGNSGGPVLMRGQVVGIAFQGLTSCENTGYIIPVPVIDHFLQDLERNGGRYSGFCEMGVAFQGMEAEDMKTYLGMPPGLTGVYVTKTEPLFHASKVLQEGDVITHFDGHQLADDGTFAFQQAVRIDFRHLVSMKFHGQAARLRVWRAGQPLEMDVSMALPKHLVPIHSHDVKPSYFIYAGLVLTKLSAFYLRSVYGPDWQMKAPIKLCDRYFAGTKASDEHEEVVVLSKVLSSELNNGYQDLGNIQVLAVNGQKVVNLAHAAALVTVAAANAQFVRFDLEWHKVVVINAAKAAAAHEDILAQNNIPSPGHSPGLLQEPHPQVLVADNGKLTSVPPAVVVSEEEGDYDVTNGAGERQPANGDEAAPAADNVKASASNGGGIPAATNEDAVTAAAADGEAASTSSKL